MLIVTFFSLLLPSSCGKGSLMFLFILSKVTVAPTLMPWLLKPYDGNIFLVVILVAEVDIY